MWAQICADIIPDWRKQVVKTTTLIQGTGLLYLCAEDALKQGLVNLLETKLLSMYGKCKGVVKCHPLIISFK